MVWKSLILVVLFLISGCTVNIDNTNPVTKGKVVKKNFVGKKDLSISEAQLDRTIYLESPEFYVIILEGEVKNAHWSSAKISRSMYLVDSTTFGELEVGSVFDTSNNSKVKLARLSPLNPEPHPHAD